MDWLIQNTIYLSATALLIMTARKALRGKVPAAGICLLWVLLLIRLLSPLLPTASFSLFQHIPIQGGELQTFEEVILPSIGESISVGMHLSHILVAAWLLGAIILFAYYLITAAVFTYQSNQFPESQDCDDLLKKAKEQLGITARIKVRCGGETPILIGKCILIPSGYQAQEKYHILIHELCHYKYKDTFWIWLSLFLLSLQWFNPIIWISCFRFRKDLESLCDERALKYIPDRKAYAMLLLKTALHQTNFIAGAVGIQNGKKEVAERIREIAKNNKIKVKWIVLLAVLSVVIGAVCLTNAQNLIETPSVQMTSGIPEALKQSIEKGGYHLVNELEATSWKYELFGNVIYTDSDTGIRYDAEKIADKYGYHLQDFYGQKVQIYLYDTVAINEPLKSNKQIFLSAVLEDGRIFTIRLESDEQKEWIKKKIDDFMNKEGADYYEKKI